MPLRIPRFIVAATLIVATPCAHAQTPDAVSPRDITGAWILNKSDSDKERPTPPGGERGGRRGGGGGRGGFGGGGGGGGGLGGGLPGGGMPPGGRGGRGAMPDQEEMKSLREMVDEFMRPSDRLTIIQQDDAATVKITDADGRTRTYAVTGKKEKHQLQSGTYEMQSKWEGGTLRQEGTVGRMKVVRIFAKDAERHQLKVTVSFADAPKDRPPFTSIYDDATAQ